MNLSEVKVKLSGPDILSIINEFVKVDGLTLKKVIINDGIELEGNLKKGISIDFSVKAEILGCRDNKIIAKLSKVKILNFKIFRMIRSFALKKLSKEFSSLGIESDKDKVEIDIKKVLKDVPYVDLDITDIYLKGAGICVEAENINLSIAGSIIKETDEVKEEQQEESTELLIVNKIEDNYTIGRKILENKLPENTKAYKDYIFILPDIISLIYRLLKDKRVPLKTKLVMSSAIAYVTFPTDLIPDSIPFIGKIDDLGITLFALNKVLNDVPLNIVVENWAGKNDLLMILKNGLEYLNNFTSAKNVEKLYAVIGELSTL